MRNLTGDERESPKLGAIHRRIVGRFVPIVGSFSLCVGMAALVSGCHGDSSGPAAPVSQAGWTQAAHCTSTAIAAAFAQDPETKVVNVVAFNPGDPLTLVASSASTAPVATTQVCGVQLLIGPGNPGPASAPSTSTGIGVSIYLPTQASWNKRLHFLGGAGWQGSLEGNGAVTHPLTTPEQVVQQEGAVAVGTDSGNQTPADGGSFLMNPDGSINEGNWKNYSELGIHEALVKAKAVTATYFGSAPQYSYYEGGSTGGRTGVKSAQAYPSDFNGIIVGYPSVNWTRFLTAGVYPQIVFQQDLGGVPLTTAQEDLVSNAAISSCDVVGGVHLGYISDPQQCTYDPTKDATVLCPSDGGTNATSACVTKLQANAINKIWYGMTSDGSVPDPTVDNGWSVQPTGVHRWYGNTRGTSLWGQWWVNVFGLPASFPVAYASPYGVFSPPLAMLALELQNPAIGDSTFVNATGNGQNAWKTLGYAGLNNAFDQGIALQPQFDNVNSDNPDLSAFKAAGGKMIAVHGLSDELVYPQGSINYYTNVANQMGGISAVQQFFKLYFVAGMGHSSTNGTANAGATVPIPTANQPYDMLTGWVEQGVEPGREVLTDPTGNVSRPMCPYPQKPQYTSGSPLAAASYVCS